MGGVNLILVTGVPLPCRTEPVRDGDLHHPPGFFAFTELLHSLTRGADFYLYGKEERLGDELPARLGFSLIVVGLDSTSHLYSPVHVGIPTDRLGSMSGGVETRACPCGDGYQRSRVEIEVYIGGTSKDEVG